MVHTKFETARLVGARALQIKMGAPVLIKVPRGVEKPIEIARLELEHDVIPMSVRVREEKKIKPPVKVVIPDIPLDEEDVEEVKETKGEAAEEESLEEEIIVEDTE